MNRIPVETSKRGSNSDQLVDLKVPSANSRGFLSFHVHASAPSGTVIQQACPAHYVIRQWRPFTFTVMVFSIRCVHVFYYHVVCFFDVYILSRNQFIINK